ncbi:MAG: hypothetical protein GY834_16240 [Bacteroidetes bacterium]|nr:hypothetical protein [Bacteroidota bacterium]
MINSDTKKGLSKYWNLKSLRKTIMPHTGCLLVIAFLILFVSCSSDNCGPDCAKISIDFTWDLKNMDISPKLILQSVPKGTTHFKIKMFDLSNRYPHGNEKIINDGSNIIKAGTIDPYQEPQPMFGPTRYEFTIKALNQDGKIIGIGKKMRKFG